MKNKIFFFIYIATILSLLTIPSLFLKAEAVRYDPELNWQVLESPHFSIYFCQHKQQNDRENNSRNEKLAQEIANIAEETYSQINTQISSPKHHHMQKIAIIMEDFSDYALGFASSFPNRVIRLSLTAPTAKSFDMKFKSWLKMVIIHEYTHIAHFEMTGGLTTALRALFGQIITPNGLQPTWSIEGLAVYNETKFTTEGGGRGIDPRYDMYLRMAALEGEDHFNTLDQISGYYLTSWPGSTAPYIYGQSLIHFIAQRYGEDKVITLSEIFCRYPYLGFNYAFKRTLGLDLDELYQNWKEYLKEKYQTQIQKISSEKNLTKSQQLTNYHYWVDYPRWISTSAPTASSATEDKIAIKVSTPHSYPFIQIIDPSASMASLTYSTIKKQSLVKRTYGRDSSFSISPDGSKIIYSKLTNYNQFYQFYDLYLYDLKLDKEVRLSEGLRLRDPDWSPDPDPDPDPDQKNPQQIVAVINNSGTNNLILINLPSPLPISSTKTQSTYNLITKKDIIYLTNFDDGTQIYQPSWSPNGDIIAFSAWRQGYQDIYIVNLNSANIVNSTLQPIFHDKATDLSPYWSPDSNYLFFSSDRTGIYNIFAFSLLDKKLYQVTNVISGAFQPTPSPDGRKLAYIEYHSTGYELHLMELDPEQWTQIEYVMPSNPKDNPEIQLSYQQTDRLKNQNLITNPSKSNYPVHPYHPFASFWPPTYWLPAAQITENDLGIGFSTELEDILGFYSLPITITYGVLNNNLNYNLDYYNYRHYPLVNLFLQGSTDLNSSVSTPTSWGKEGKAGINIYFPFQGQTISSSNSRSYRQIFSLGYQYEKTYLAKVDNTNQTNQENIASFKLSYTYSDAEKYGFSISPEQGQAFSLNYEHADKIIGSNYTFDKFIFDGRKFIDLPFLHQVLSLRLVAGCTSRNILDKEKFKLGGNYSANNLANTEVDTFSLRGYKSSFLKGNNLLSTSLEYRFPIASIEHSLKFGPFSFFLERLSGSLFIDMGNAWESINNPEKTNSFWHDFKTGIGAELKADFNRKYDSPFTLRLGAAKALNEPKGYDIYLRLGTSF